MLMRAKGGLERRPNESVPMHRARIVETKLAVQRHEMLDRWKHKNEGTPETHDHASREKQGPIWRLWESGQIDIDQLAWATEIAMVAESIARGVEVRISKYRMPVDNEASSKDVLVEYIGQVRREMAYGWWRQRIPHPKGAILDMLTGEISTYYAVARRYRLGHRRARRLLIEAIDLWPDAMNYAEANVDTDELIAAHMGLL